jgi:hypothetical protein
MRSLAVEKTGRVREDREAGAVAVVVALLFATVFIGVAAVAIDLGSLWATQRSLVTDTDAAALAAARTLSEMTRAECETQRGLALSGSGQVYNQVDELLRTNTPTDELIEVRIACGQRAGKVRVDARQPAISAFSGALGVTEPSAVGRSVAEWTRPGFNPIPLAVCDELLKDVTPQAEVTITYKSAEQDGDCLDWLGVETASDAYAPGNWGWLEVDELFDGQEFLGDIVCDLEPTGYWCEGSMGNDTSNSDDLFRTLRDADEVFQFVLFDFTRNPRDPTKTAAGRNADFRVNAVVEAKLVACLGPNGRPSNCRGNPSSLELDVIKITPFPADEILGRRADLSLCGDRLTDVCTNQDF